jgi:hypothetical protein
MVTNVSISTATAIRLAMTALALPFRRALAFARSACIPFLCWTGAWTAGIVAKYGSESLGVTIPQGLAVALNVGAIVLALVGFLGFLSFDVNWHRVAYQWPDPPEPFPLFRADGWRRSQFRPFGRSKPKIARRFLQGLILYSAVFVLLTLGLVGVLFITVQIGPEAGAVAFFSLPLIAMALQSSLSWPAGLAEAVGDFSNPEREAALVTAGPLPRLVAYFLVYVPAFGLFVVVQQVIIKHLPEAGSGSLIWPIVGMAGVLALFLLSVAWVAALGALLYAQRKTPASVFD